MMADVEFAEYETFDYKHFDETPLPLDDAIKKATQLRASYGALVHRVVAVDPKMSAFRVESVSRETVNAEILSCWADRINRFIFRSRKP